MQIFQKLCLSLGGQVIQSLYDHGIVEALFCSYACFKGIVFVLESTKRIAFFLEIDIGTPFARAFILIYAGMAGGVFLVWLFRADQGAD